LAVRQFSGQQRIGDRVNIEGPFDPAGFGATTELKEVPQLLNATAANAAGLRSSVSPKGTAVREVPISRSEA